MRMKKIAVSALCAALVAGTAAPLSSLAYGDRSGWTVKESVGQAQSNEAGNAIDNQVQTRWATDSDNSYIIVDFGKSTKFNTIVINNGAGDMPKDGYTVSTSTDGTEGSYTEQVKKYPGTANTTIITLNDYVNAQYLKLEGNGTNDPWWSIYELAVYDSAALAKSMNTAGQSLIFSGDWNSTSSMPFEIDNAGGLTAESHSGSKSVAFKNDVSDDIKAEFGSAGSSSDTTIADVYTETYINYIGTGNGNNAGKSNTVNLSDLQLKAGTYKLYVLGKGNEMGTVTCGSNTVTGSNMTTIANNVDLYTYEIKLDSDYSGDIVISRSNGWLPDIYSAKLKCISVAEDSTVSEVEALNNGAAFNEYADAPAWAYGFTVTPNDYTVTGVTVTVNNNKETSMTKTIKLTGYAEVKFGVIVQGVSAKPTVTAAITKEAD